MRRERVPGPRRARENWECIPGVPSAPLLPQDSGRSRAPNSLSGRLGVEPVSGSGRYSSRAQPPCSRPYSVPAQHSLHPQNHSPEGTHCPTPRRPACPTPQSQNSEDAVPGATLHSPRRPTRTETRLAVSRLTAGSRDDQGIQRLTPRARQQPRRTRPRRDEKAQAQRSDFPSITEPVNDQAGRTKRSLTPPAIISGPHWKPQYVHLCLIMSSLPRENE